MDKDPNQLFENLANLEIKLSRTRSWGGIEAKPPQLPALEDPVAPEEATDAEHAPRPWTETPDRRRALDRPEGHAHRSPRSPLDPQLPALHHHLARRHRPAESEEGEDDREDRHCDDEPEDQRDDERKGDDDADDQGRHALRSAERHGRAKHAPTVGIASGSRNRANPRVFPPAAALRFSAR